MASEDDLRVLLVDDDEVDRLRIRRLLGPWVAVCEAGTAAEGRACAEAEDLDLVLLDYRLPDADGVDLLPWFVELGVPVVMLTGVEDTAVIVDAMRRGALDYLVKGDLDGARLERAVRRAVETAALRRAVAEQQAQIAEQRDRLAAQAAALERTNAEVRDQERRVRDLARALTLAEQEERRRLAQVLHDDLQQVLHGAQIQAELGRAERVEALLDEAIRTTRTLSHELAPPILRGRGLGELVEWLAERERERYGLEVVHDVGDLSVPGEEVRILLHQLLRELLLNVSKHADVDRVRVTAEPYAGGLRVVVEDEGAGFDVTTLEVPRRGGMGLASVRERLELIGGRLSVSSRPGEGTRVVVEVAVEAGQP